MAIGKDILAISMNDIMDFIKVSKKDWVQDFSHENGCYLNTCIECKMEFKGHKRRVVCKECTDLWIKLKEEGQDEQPL